MQLNSTGNVESAVMLSKEEAWSPVIIDAIKKWRFDISRSPVMNFVLELRINIEGKLEIIKK